MKKKGIKKGFTIAEQVVVLIALGVIFLMLTPTLRFIFPDRDKALLKKAYFLTKRTVDEMVSNDALYPDPEFGFVDTSAVSEGGPDGASKFRAYFKGYFTGVSDKECSVFNGVNVECDESEPTNCTYTPIFQQQGGCFTTSENITWGIPDDDFRDRNTFITYYLNLNDNELRENNVSDKAYILQIDNKGRISVPKDNEIGCGPDSRLKRCQTKELLRSDNIKKEFNTKKKKETDNESEEQSRAGSFEGSIETENVGN